MRKFFLTTILTITVAFPAALAQENRAGTTTSAEESEITKGLYEKVWTISPRAGVLGYQDGNASYTSRITEGFTTDVDLTNAVSMPWGLRLGLESGFLYSHVGSPGANFFGADDPGVAPGTNAFLVPLNATVGYKPTDSSVIALNLGSTLAYRSNGIGMLFGRSSDFSSGVNTNFFPSLGLMGGVALSKSVGLSLRGDIIPTPVDDLFTATLGATIGLS